MNIINLPVFITTDNLVKGRTGMSVFVVGGDHLGDIGKKLGQLGYDAVIHLKGRKNMRKQNLQIPEETGLVIVLTDYVDHNIAYVIKQNAKARTIPVVYSKLSWSWIQQKLQYQKGLPCG
jgi:hypothetical protein